MLHVALDNQRENQPSTSRNVAPVIIIPYFPLGLAVSPEERTQFNFNLFLYDSLRLPNGLFPGDAAGEKVFEDLQTCRDYCSRYVQKREEWCGREQVESDHSQERRNELSKEDMFLTAGEPLDVTLKYGNDAFDRNLKLVRLDLFGNVMILNAPHWSDVAAQFTHGFPRRLIIDSHRGILPGNITVAARISNQAIRSLSPGNWEEMIVMNINPLSANSDQHQFSPNHIHRLSSAV